MEIDSYSPYKARIKIPTVVYQPLTELRPPVRGVGCESRVRRELVTGRIKTSHLWAIQNQPLTPCGTRDAFRPMVAPQEGDRGWQ